MPDKVVVGTVDSEPEQVSLDLLRSQNKGLTLDRSPEEILVEAHRAATALKRVLDAKTEKVMMNDEQYLEFEDWQTVGHFFATTCKEDGDPEAVFFGEVKGFKASALAIRNGRAISRATAYCLSDEPKWNSRPKYEWQYVCKDGSIQTEDPGKDNIIWEKNPKTEKNRPKKVRNLIGEEPVPFFQLASMAQTRANAKVLRNVLAWVVVLAGYKPVPAEELGDEAKRETQDSDDADDSGDRQAGKAIQELNNLIAELESVGVTRAQIAVKFRHDPAVCSPAEIGFLKSAITTLKNDKTKKFNDLPWPPAEAKQASTTQAHMEPTKQTNGKAAAAPADKSPSLSDLFGPSLAESKEPEPTHLTIRGTPFVKMFADVIKAEGWTNLEDINGVLKKEWNILGIEDIPQDSNIYESITKYFKDHRPPKRK